MMGFWVHSWCCKCPFGRQKPNKAIENNFFSLYGGFEYARRACNLLKLMLLCPLSVISNFQTTMRNQIKPLLCTELNCAPLIFNCRCFSGLWQWNMYDSPHVTITLFPFTGNVKLGGDSVKQCQASPPRQSAAEFQPRNDGTHFCSVLMLLQVVTCFSIITHPFLFTISHFEYT